MQRFTHRPFSHAVIAAVAMAVMLVGSAAAKGGASAENTLAICGCGMVFVPDANTPYLKAGDKEYACCTKACHEMASKDPAGSAKMFDAAAARLTAQLSHLKLGVDNVVSVTDKGTKALCGCGKQFTIDETTEFIKYEGKAYACCTHECHLMAAKDPAAAAKAADKLLGGSEMH
ncbi:MAG TPA: hypothetical protein VN285_06410 [Candidatus Deferrimicrobium sp.]|nr:hypothetical protein [Candidatus Deferrimicrobium sp.]